MMTRVTRSPRVAAHVIRDGGVVAFPTETVYGLGADVFNPAAIRSVYQAKGRPRDNPLIVHVASLSAVSCVARRIPQSAERLMEHFFPGPLTVIVPRHPDVPEIATAGLDTVGVRYPRHPLTQAFLRACDTPVAAPSANRSGRPSPTTWSAVQEEMEGRIPCILKGGASDVGLESTVVDCSGRVPVVLRLGGVSVEELRAVISAIRVPTGSRSSPGPTKSPGTKYRHYAPHANVVIIEHGGQIEPVRPARFAYIGITAPPTRPSPALTMICREVPEYARRLFHFFRAAEKLGVQTIYCQRVPPDGLGRALMDRLQRAAAARPTRS